MNSIKIDVKDFNLIHIFDCGQCFRWRKMEDGFYIGVALNRVVSMKEDRGTLTIIPLLTPNGVKASEEKALWRDYLDLDRDYGTIKRKLRRGDPAMAKAIKAGEGIRILKQDLWETIISFIISQNNHIPRIKGCIESLAENFGEPVAGLDRRCLKSIELPEGLKPFNLPTPEKLAKLKVEDLAPIKLGYRDKYLIETAKTVAEEGLPKDFDKLSKLCGVGPKVANCIALFGMEKTASFPIDVWVKRVMAEVYGFEGNDLNGMKEFAGERFGELGGFAQQYLFYYIRERNK